MYIHHRTNFKKIENSNEWKNISSIKENCLKKDIWFYIDKFEIKLQHEIKLG
jgi:hypothetical protein